jgi:hypothetical protein
MYWEYWRRMGLKDLAWWGGELFKGDTVADLKILYSSVPIPVAARSKALVCGRSLAGIAGSNPAGSMYVSCECCVLWRRGLCNGRSIVQRSPTECAVSEYDLEAATIRRSWPTRAVEPWGGGKLFISIQWESIRKSSLRIAANSAEIRAKHWYKLLLNRNWFYPQPSKLIIYIILPLGVIPIRTVVKGAKGKDKAVPLQAWSGPVFQEVKVPRFHDNGTGWW